MLTEIAEHYNYAVVIVLMMTGLYVVFASSNMIKKLVGLSVFQTSVFLLYITIGKVKGGIPPIIPSLHGGDYGDDYAASAISQGAQAAAGKAQGSYGAASGASDVLYSNPLPHVLILTAIVVGVATLAVGLALVVRIREVYGTIEETEIDAIDYQFNLEGVSPDTEQGAR